MKPVYAGDKAVKGNVSSVYQVHPVRRITCEGRAEVLRASGPEFEQEGAAGTGGTGGATQSVRGNYKSFKGTNLSIVEGRPQFIISLSCISCKSYNR